MKKIILFLVVLAVMSLKFSGCKTENSEDVNQDRIFTVYELFYNANEDVTYANARFRFGNVTGTLLELSDPSFVEFNGQQLDYKPALAFYQLKMAGYIDSGMFHWEDTDGKAFENTIKIHEIFHNDTITAIDKDAAYEYFWKGDPLAADETATLTINGKFEGDARIFVNNSLGSKSIILQKNKIEQLPANEKATLWLDRTYQPDLTEKTGAGGLIFGKYRPENVEVLFE